MADKLFLAVDLGASSGRHVAGRFDGQRMTLEECHRFENSPVAAAGHLYWDVLSLWSQIKAGLQVANARYAGQIASVGIDTWGVDFGLLGRGDELLGNPYNYRDCRTEGMLDKAFSLVSREEIFAQTGIQFMQINTLYQLLSMQLSGSPLLQQAKSFLMMPDLFNWLLTGEKVNELTNATTTQCFNPRDRAWAGNLLGRLGIPTHILGRLAEPGTKLGPLRQQVRDELGLGAIDVVLPGTHDTASAVLAVPAEQTAGQRPNWCYISSGTWSLMGVETPEPVINEKSLKLNFTNEGGIGGTTRLLKNIGGLWLVQQCRQAWKSTGRSFTWDELNQLAAEARPLAALVDPDDPSFLAPANMPDAIRAFCRRAGQTAPETEGAVIRCAIESLAMRYRQVLAWLEELIGGRIDVIHIVGGGTQNRLLCQATADACNRRVLAGPVEATALGNVLMQAVSSGDLASVADAREVVRRSFPVEEYNPGDSAAWNDAYQRFLRFAIL